MRNPLARDSRDETTEAASKEAPRRRAPGRKALDNAISVVLSAVLVLTMSPVAPSTALAVDKYDNGNFAGGGLLAH